MIFKDKKAEKLIKFLMGPVSDFSKSEQRDGNRTTTINYSTGKSQFLNKSFTYMTADGLVVTLIEMIIELQGKVEKLESKRSK